jgi:hypothetical protein
MTTNRLRHHGASVGLVLALAALTAGPIFAQTRAGGPAPAPTGAAAQRPPRPRPAPPAGQVAEEPIRCWWKTDRTAVSVGERFMVVLTCAALEAGQTVVVPNVSQLEGGAVQLTPFEVVSSTRRADVVAQPWRYIQFEYGLRLLADGFFGQDVGIPPLTVTYNYRTADGANTGRDQTYVLPALTMRVLSLVPRAAADIRDTSAMTFGDIEAARFRATLARVASWIATAFAVVLAALALLRASQRFRKRAPEATRQVSDLARLGACAAALREVRKDAASGWSADLARRALPALRLAGASALGRPVAQERVGRDADVREGQIVVRNGWLRRGRTLLSASTTRVTIDAANAQKGLTGRARGALAALGPAIEAFSLVAYGRGTTPPDGVELNAALDQSLDAVQRLRTGALWPVRTMTALARTFSSV